MSDWPVTRASSSTVGADISRLSTVSLTAICAVLMVPTVAADWVMAQGSAARAGASDVTSAPRSTWAFPIEGPIALQSAPPLVVRDAVYAAKHNGIVAVELSGGTKIWSFEMGVSTVAPLAFDNGSLVVATRDNTIRALDVATGRELWKVALRAPPSGGAIAIAGLVIVGVEDGSCTAIRDGRVMWETRYADGMQGAPIYHDNRVFCAGDEGKVVSLDPSTGGILWNTTLGFDVNAPPLAVDQTIVLATSRPGLIALSTAAGTVVWSTELSGGSENPPAFSNGTVFVDGGPELVAIESATGMIRWVRAIESIDTGPVLSGSTAVVTNVFGKAIAVDSSSGEPIGSRSLGVLVHGGPSIANGWMYATVARGGSQNLFLVAEPLEFSDHESIPNDLLPILGIVVLAFLKKTKGDKKRCGQSA